VRINVSRRQLKDHKNFRSKDSQSTYSQGSKQHDFGTKVNQAASWAPDPLLFPQAGAPQWQTLPPIPAATASSAVKKKCKLLGMHQTPLTAPFHPRVTCHISQGTGTQSRRFYIQGITTNLSLPRSQEKKKKKKKQAHRNFLSSSSSILNSPPDWEVGHSAVL